MGSVPSGSTDVQALKGCILYQGPAKTLEEMESAISEHCTVYRKVGLTEELPEEMLEAVLAAKPPAAAKAFDHEVEKDQGSIL